jgi:hypothetical protein
VCLVCPIMKLLIPIDKGNFVPSMTYSILLSCCRMFNTGSNDGADGRIGFYFQTDGFVSIRPIFYRIRFNGIGKRKVRVVPVLSFVAGV